MNGGQIGFLKPHQGPFIVQSLPEHIKRTLSIVLVMNNDEEQVTEFVNRTLNSIRELPAHKKEVIIVDLSTDKQVSLRAKYLIQRWQSLYLLKLPQGTNRAQAIFRAWQQSRAQMLGYIEIGDFDALNMLPAMIDAAKQAIESEEADIVVGHHRLSLRWEAIAHQSTLRAMVAQLCGKVIMPDLFSHSAHPLSTCLFVRRAIIEQRQMILYGSIMLPNLITHIPEARIVEIPYPKRKRIESGEEGTNHISLRALISMLFRLNIFHKTHMSLNK